MSLKPLHTASRRVLAWRGGHSGEARALALLKVLLAAGADPNARTRSGNDAARLHTKPQLLCSYASTPMSMRGTRRHTLLQSRCCWAGAMCARRCCWRWPRHQRYGAKRADGAVYCVARCANMNTIARMLIDAGAILVPR